MEMSPATVRNMLLFNSCIPPRIIKCSVFFKLLEAWIINSWHVTVASCHPQLAKYFLSWILSFYNHSSLKVSWLSIFCWLDLPTTFGQGLKSDLSNSHMMLCWVVPKRLTLPLKPIVDVRLMLLRLVIWVSWIYCGMRSTLNVRVS